MKFQPFLAAKLLRPCREDLHFGVPLQLCLIPDMQPGMDYALRLHHATRLHFDFRIKILNSLFCLAMDEAPSFDPARFVRARLMADHDPNNLQGEYVIPAGRPGAGPTMPVDVGKCFPIAKTYSTYEQEMLDQLARKDLRFTMDGEHLKGAWRLVSRNGEYWSLRKLQDEHASATRVLRLNRSIKTGGTLEDLRRRFATRPDGVRLGKPTQFMATLNDA